MGNTFKSFIIASSIGLFSVLIAGMSQVNAEDYVTTSGNEYIGNESVEVNSTVKGDLVSAGEKVVVNENVEDNGVIVGRKILIEKDILGDLWVAGGYVVINGSVLGDIRIAGGEVYINSEVIRGDLTVFAGKVSISSKTQIFGEEILNTNKEVRNAEDNPTDLSNADDAIGDIGNNISAISSSFSGAMSTIGMFFSIIMFFGGLVLSYFIIRVFPVFTEDTLNTIKKDYLKSFGIGLLMLILGPVIAFLLLISVVGIKVMFFLILLAMLATTISHTLLRYLLGRLIFMRMGKKKTGRLIPLVVGSTIFAITFFILSFIPGGWFLTVLVNLIVTSVGVGAILLNKFRALD